MFVDVVKVFIKGGDGGNGAISFHREKYVPDGGPDGGDGGNGGNVIFTTNASMMTLMDFRYKARFVADNGQNGGGSNMTGKTGKELEIEVPPGTLIKDAQTGDIIADMVAPGQKALLMRGGRGGKGNAHFTTSIRRSPRFSQLGEKGEERWVILELKSIADVGLIGFPNVGKSTILSVLTSARPKIADYHFTTLAPNLGVVREMGGSFVLADIPGLIEGAHTGIGLGHDFLRHIERTRILVHVIDASGIEGRDPVQDFYAINRELDSYGDKLARLPQVVAANKSDLPEVEANIVRLKEELEPQGIKVFPVSAAINSGFDSLLKELFKMLESIASSQPPEDVQIEFNIPGTKELKPIEIKREGAVYLVSGSIVEKLLRTVNLDDHESLNYFQRMCKKRGIIDKLKKMGIANGDTVRIGDVEFDFVE